MNFLSFVPDYWDGPRHNRHYFCLELAKQHRVLFVSPPFYIGKLLRRDARRHAPRSGLTRVTDRLFTYVPPKWLFTNHRFPWLHRLLREIRIFLLRRLARKYGFTDPVLLVWHPAHLEMLGRFGERLVVYYIYDHLSGYSGGDPRKRWSSELELIRKADLVFVLSHKLLEENRQYNSNIHLLANAVDFDLFAQARSESTEIPADISSIRGPRIGYIGTINEKVNVELLSEVASSRPAWSIVLIGRENYKDPQAKKQFENLVARSNVHWLPYKEPAALPGYLKALDVCLMCYVVNGWTYYGDPSKMHEYLAAGKPTVGAPLPAIQEFSNVVRVAESNRDWIDAIQASLGEQGVQHADERIHVARLNSYPERIRRAIELIEAALARKQIADSQP